MKLIDPGYEHSINHRFREKRFRFFLNLYRSLSTHRPIQILDVGGTEVFWERMNFLQTDSNFHITLLNLEQEPVKYARLTSVKGNACHMPEFGDKQFDIVFSNSVIEHLFSRESQQQMAQEVRRVGRNYYIQTPNFYFPIEPHWMFPFFQFLPFGTRVALTRNFDLGHYPKATSEAEAIERVNEVKLLTEEEMQSLFPEGKVYRENLLGLIKSITLYHFPDTELR